LSSLDELFGNAIKSNKPKEEVSPPSQGITIDAAKPAENSEKRKPFDEKEVLKRFKEMTTIGITQEDAIYQLSLEFIATEDKILNVVSAPAVATPSSTPSNAITTPSAAKPPASDINSLFGTPEPPKPAESPKLSEATKATVDAPVQNVMEPPSSPPVIQTATRKYVEAGEGKIAIMVYGVKGEGKSSIALGTVTATPAGEKPTVIAISLDRQTAPIKRRVYQNDNRIKVFDVIGEVNYSSPAQYLSSSEEAFNYIQGLIRDVIKPICPDFIVIDGSEIMQKICEMVMRSRNNLMPFQGISNLNLWKERQMYLRQIHNLAMEAAGKGVIYTAYVEKDEIIEDGNFKSKKDHPKWIDVIMMETSLVIRARTEQGRDGQLHFIAYVESSKTDMPTGLTADVTGVENMKKFWSRLNANN
jgi:hypothetical protein